MGRLSDAAAAAIAEINALPMTRRTQHDPAYRDEIITWVLARTVYDWEAIDKALFPDGDPLRLDLTKPDDLKAWTDIRSNQRQLAGDWLDSLPNVFTDKTVTFAPPGLTATIDVADLLNLDPATPPMDDVWRVLSKHFPSYVQMDQSRKLWVLASHENVFHRRSQDEIAALAPRILQQKVLRYHVWEQFAMALNTSSGIINPTNTVDTARTALRDIQRLNTSKALKRALVDQKVIIDHVERQKVINAQPSAPKRTLEDFLNERLTKARLALDPSTALDQFNAIPMLGARAKNAKANRTWGIELEIIDAGAIAFDAAGGWTRERDGSLRAQIGDGRTYDPWEFVSPILSDTYSPGLWMICDQAKNTVKYHKAGVHVHVSATNRARKVYDPKVKRPVMKQGAPMTTAEVSRLIEIYATFSPLFDPIIARTKTREFCIPTRVDQWANGWYEAPASKKPHRRMNPLRGRSLSALDNAKNWAEPTQGPAHDGPTNWKRHQELNLQSLNKYGTIEFRAMGANYDYEYLTRWAWLCRAMVDYAQSDAPLSAIYRVTDLAGLVSLLNSVTPESLNLRSSAKRAA